MKVRLQAADLAEAKLGFWVGIPGRHALLIDFSLNISRGFIEYNTFKDKPLGFPLKRAWP